MAIIVVGGSGRGVGKTSLVCGLIAALKGFRWTAVKITDHGCDGREAIWEEATAGPGSDTARYLAAGAKRAFLVTAPKAHEFPALLDALWKKLEPGANVLFESNRILDYVKPDVCLMVRGGTNQSESKASFSQAVCHADAMVVQAGKEEEGGPNPAQEPKKSWAGAKEAAEKL